MRVPCHVHLGVLQSTKGGHLLMRRAYQECLAVTVAGESTDWSRFREYHRGTVMLTPPGADATLATTDAFSRALLASERRKRAQHARTLDVSLPRGVSGFELLFAAWIVAPLIEMGMIAQVDAESLPASDGGENPHFHACFAMRRVNGSAFGLKQRQWNGFFRQHEGRHVRALLASRIVAAAAHLGQGVVVDPRRKSFYSGAPPEPRFALARWRAHAETGNDTEIKAVLARRGESDLEPMSAMPEGEIIEIASAALAGAKPEEHLAAWQAAYDCIRRCGYEVIASGSLPGDEFVVVRTGLALTFDASATLQIRRNELHDGDWEEIADLIRALGWPALVVQGSQHALDALGVLLAPNGIAPVNHSMSSLALQHVAHRGLAGLLADVKQYDQKRVLEEMCAPLLESGRVVRSSSRRKAPHVEAAAETVRPVGDDDRDVAVRVSTSFEGDDVENSDDVPIIGEELYREEEWRP